MPYQTNIAANIPFTLIKAADGTPATGATVTAYITIDNGSQGTGSGTVTESGHGDYNYAASTSDMNGKVISFVFSATGAIPSPVKIRTVGQSFDLAYLASYLTGIVATALTETSGYLAAGFKKLLNVASPAFTVASVNQTKDVGVQVPTALTYDGADLPLVDAATFAGSVPVQTAGKLWVLDAAGNATPTDASIQADCAQAISNAGFVPNANFAFTAEGSDSITYSGVLRPSGVQQNTTQWSAIIGSANALLVFDGSLDYLWQLEIYNAANDEVFTASSPSLLGPWTVNIGTSLTEFYPLPVAEENASGQVLALDGSGNPLATASALSSVATNVGTAVSQTTAAAIGAAVWNFLAASVASGLNMGKWLLGISNVPIAVGSIVAQTNTGMVVGSNIQAYLNAGNAPFILSPTINGSPYTMTGPVKMVVSLLASSDSELFEVTGALTNTNQTVTFTILDTLNTPANNYVYAIYDTGNNNLLLSTGSYNIKDVGVSP